MADGEDRNVAFSIGRRVTNAVGRNLLRRRLRTLFDEIGSTQLPGLYLITCGSTTDKLSYDELRHHLHQALERCRGY